MKRILLILSCLLASQGVFAQTRPDITLEELRHKDLSMLWLGAIPIIDREDTTTLEWVERSELLGYIGKDYRRFDIHFTSVCKKADNPLCYRLKGKTRTGENICDFEGELQIDSVGRYPDSGASAVWGGIYSGWYLKGHYTLRENSAKPGSGVLTGTHKLDIATDTCGNIYYDTMWFVADGYSNNQWQGTWRSYKTGAKKPCNWGDGRIPESQWPNGDLDVGTGVFIPNEKYFGNGWQSFVDAWGEGEKAKTARREENRMWW